MLDEVVSTNLYIINFVDKLNIDLNNLKEHYVLYLGIQIDNIFKNIGITDLPA